MASSTWRIGLGIVLALGSAEVAVAQAQAQAPQGGARAPAPAPVQQQQPATPTTPGNTNVQPAPAAQPRSQGPQTDQVGDMPVVTQDYAPPRQEPEPPSPDFEPAADDGKLQVAMDAGTGSSLAYAEARVVELGGESGTESQPHLYLGSYVEYVARTGHEAPGVHA